jgi:hypothetical protein
LQIFKDHGYNWIRLRLFHSPTNLPNNLDYTLALAKRARELNYKFLLNFHYSDTWADPGKQFTPAAWRGLSHEELVRAVRDYTRDSVRLARRRAPGHGADRHEVMPSGAGWKAAGQLGATSPILSKPGRARTKVAAQTQDRIMIH